MHGDNSPWWVRFICLPVDYCKQHSIPYQVYELTREQVDAYFSQSLFILEMELEDISAFETDWIELKEEAEATIERLASLAVPESAA
jgi:hypothetical protein